MNTLLNTNLLIYQELALLILNQLGCNLEPIPGFGISHQLWYDSTENSCTIMGYVWIENDIYYTTSGNNHSTPELAALDLLDKVLVQTTAAKILLERQLLPDYF